MIKYHSYPVFVSLLDAIAYHQIRTEKSAECMFNSKWLYDMVMNTCETETEEEMMEQRKESFMFPVQKTQEIEGVTFSQIEVNNKLYWTWNYNG